MNGVRYSVCVRVYGVTCWCGAWVVGCLAARLGTGSGCLSVLTDYAFCNYCTIIITTIDVVQSYNRLFEIGVYLLL